MNRFLIVWLAIFSSSIWAQAPSAPAQSTGQNPFANPAYNQSLLNQPNQALYQRCFGQPNLGGAQNLAQDLLKKWGVKTSTTELAKTPTLKLSQECKGEPNYAPYERLDFRCEDFRSASMFDLRLLENRLEQVQKDEKSAEEFNKCEAIKYEGVKEQLECLQMQTESLNQLMQSVQGEYQRNFQKAQEGLQEAEKVQQARQSQICDAWRILGGEETPKECKEMGIVPGPGDPSLLSLRQMALYGDGKENKGGLVQQMRVGFEAAQRQQRVLDMRKKIFKEKEKALPMALAKQCFMNQRIEGYACSESDRTVSAAQHLLCRYQQNQQLDKSGRVSRNRVSQTQADQKRKDLQNVIERMLSQIPEIPAFNAQPGDEKNPLGENPVNFSRPAGTIFSLDDMMKKYGSQLSKFDNAQTPVRDFVLSSFQFCYNQAVKQIQQERGSNLSMIEQERNVIDEQDRLLRQANGQMIAQYAQFYSEGIRGLTGLDIPIDPIACEKGDHATQVKCMNQLRDSIDGLVTGKTPESEMKIMLKGGSQNEVVTCRGINGCSQKLSNFTKNAQSELVRIQQQKQQMTQKMNMEADQFSQKMAEALAPQAKLVRDGVNQMNKALVEMGATPLQIKDAPVENLQPDKGSGLYRVPSSAAAVINGKLNPKLPDLQGDGVSNSLKTLATASENKKTKQQGLAKIQDAKRKLVALKSSCVEFETQQSLYPTKQDIEVLFQNRCNYNKAFCESISSSGGLEDLETVMRDISQYLGVSMGGGSSSSLSGFACESTEYAEDQCENPVIGFLSSYGVQMIKSGDVIDFNALRTQLRAITPSLPTDELSRFNGLEAPYSSCMGKASESFRLCNQVYNKIKSSKGKIETIGRKYRLGEDADVDEAY